MVMAAAVLAVGCVRVDGSKMMVSMDYDNPELYTVGNGEVDVAGVTEIDVDWVKGDIDVVAYEGEKIVIEECSEDGLAEELEVRHLVQDGVLKVKYAKSGKQKEMPVKKLTVKVPQGLVLDGLDVNAVTGDVTLSGLTAKHVEVEGVTSVVRADGLKGNNVEVQTVTGSVTLDLAESEGVELKAVEVETVMGEVTVTLPEGKGYEAEAETTVGKVTCEGAEKIEKGKYRKGNGEVEMDLTTVTGDVKVKNK